MSRGEARLLAGRYRLDGLLGRGGMSEVYHGYDERLDRRVAIKLLRPSAADLLPGAPDSPEAAELLDARERDRKRFLREIRTTAQLEHPGTPAVYDTGVETAADGRPELWLVMQLLRGSTLEALLDRADYVAAPPNIAWAASIAAQIAAVLADVHRVDIVHRDIKPGNVMIVDGGLVKVLDFGIAILRGAGALPRLTQVDRTVGTPAYMSPEQCLGQVVTSASDVYSLGCLLYELVTGDVPFHATADTSLRAQHLQAPAPSVRAQRADVPGPLAEVVASMLSKQAHQRPSAEAVYETLLPLISPTTLAVEPSAASGTAAMSQVDALHDENRDPTRPFRRPLLAPPPRPQRAVAADEESERKPLTDAEAERVRSEAQILLDADRPAEAIRLLEDAVERAGHDPFLALRLRHFLAAALFYADEYSRAAALFDVVGREYRRHLTPADPLVLDCAYHAGHAYAEIGNPDKAMPQLRFYVQNADPPSRPADSREEEAEKVRDSRYVIAQMLAADGRLDEAQTELVALRPLFAAAFGGSSTQVRNLDKQIARLRAAGDDRGHSG